MKNEYSIYCEHIAKEIEAYACGAIKENGETLSLYNWVDDVLDFEFIVDRCKHYVSAKIYVTLGGPNVWIDTAARVVKLTWGGNCAEYPIAEDAAEQLDDVMIDIYTNL
jgi:hypothetical protein